MSAQRALSLVFMGVDTQCVMGELATCCGFNAGIGKMFPLGRVVCPFLFTDGFSNCILVFVT